MPHSNPQRTRAQLAVLDDLKQQAHDQLRLYLELDGPAFKKILDERGIDHHHASHTLKEGMLEGDQILQEKTKNHPLKVRFYTDNLSFQRKKRAF